MDDRKGSEDRRRLAQALKWVKYRFRAYAYKDAKGNARLDFDQRSRAPGAAPTRRVADANPARFEHSFSLGEIELILDGEAELIARVIESSRTRSSLHKRAAKKWAAANRTAKKCASAREVCEEAVAKWLPKYESENGSAKRADAEKWIAKWGSEDGSKKWITDWIAKERALERERWDALKTKRERQLKGPGGVSPALNDFLARVACKEVLPPKGKEGPKIRCENRDDVIRSVVMDLCEYFKLKPTRRDKTRKGNCAYDVVSRILEHYGLELKLKAFEKIWEARSDTPVELVDAPISSPKDDSRAS